MQPQETIPKGLSGYFTTEGAMPGGKNFVLAIGIDAYQHCPRLYNAVKDARDFVQLLMEKYQFEPENIYTMFDEAATRANILAELKKLVKVVGREDNLVIYYSGHGLFDEELDEGYWIPVEARLNPEDTADFISNDEIIRFIRSIKSKHTFLVVDSCFSGTLFAQVRSAGIARLETRPSRWALASGRKEPVLDGRPGMNSPFSGYLLNYLRDNNKKNLLVSELVQYVKETVANNAEQIPIGNPLQNVGDEGGEFAFHLKADEEEAWAACQRENTVAAYQFFIQQFPDGRHSSEAVRNLHYQEEEEAWAKAQSEHTILSYYQFDRAFPNGRYTNSALDAIRALEEEQTWQGATAEDSLSAYRSYTRKYPNGKYQSQAEERMGAIIEKQSPSYAQPPAGPKVVETKQPPPAAAAQAAREPQGAIADGQPDINSMKRKLLWIVPALIAIAILIVWGIAKLAPGTGAEEERAVQLQAFYDAPSGRYGYKNEAGAVVIPADFEHAEQFSDGVARVKKGGSVFYIDESGQCVRDCPVSLPRPDQGQEDEDAWSAALANGREEAFNTYLERFPNGQYSEQARQKLRDFEASRQAVRDARDEDRAWEAATTQNTLEAYQAYRQRYPQGKHYQEAGRRIARFEAEIARDEAAWKQAVGQNTIPAFTAYREQFPNGIHYREAGGKIKELQNQDIEKKKIDDREQSVWNAAISQNTIAAYDAYIQQFPKGIYYQQAQAKRTELLKKEEEKMREEAVWKQVSQRNTIKDYRQYQQQYPNGIYYQEAQRRINALSQWGNCDWVTIGAQKSHQAGAPWLPNGYLITAIDLDGLRDYGEHDSPVIGRVRACNLEGVQWGDCKWIPVGPQKSHQTGSPWLPEGYYISQIDLDGFQEGSAHDSPVIGQVRACSLAGFTGWADCQWIKIGITNSHQGAGQWCPNGYFITQIDLDGDSSASGHDSPFIGQIKCCKPAQ